MRVREIVYIYFLSLICVINLSQYIMIYFVDIYRCLLIFFIFYFFEKDCASQVDSFSVFPRSYFYVVINRIILVNHTQQKV